MGLLQMPKSNELETKQTSCFVGTKYYCHIKYDRNHFRYVKQAEYNCHQNKKVANCFDRRLVYSQNVTLVLNAKIQDNAGSQPFIQNLSPKHAKMGFTTVPN